MLRPSSVARREQEIDAKCAELHQQFIHSLVNSYTSTERFHDATVAKIREIRRATNELNARRTAGLESLFEQLEMLHIWVDQHADEPTPRVSMLHRQLSLR